MKRNELEPGARAILESIENWEDSTVKEYTVSLSYEEILENIVALKMRVDFIKTLQKVENNEKYKEEYNMIINVLFAVIEKMRVAYMEG